MLFVGLAALLCASVSLSFGQAPEGDQTVAKADVSSSEMAMPSAEHARVNPRANAAAAPPKMLNKKRTTQAEREAAAKRLQAGRAIEASMARGKAAGARAAGTDGSRLAVVPNGIPDYFGVPNWAYSPRMAKFVDGLPGLGAANANSRGQYISVGKPDIVTYPGSDYYEISLGQFSEQFHSQLPATTVRGYVQTNLGTDTGATGCGASPKPPCTAAFNRLTPDPYHFLGPVIVAYRDRPVRVKFTNNLPTGVLGRLPVPVDVTIMGAGPGPEKWLPTMGGGEAAALCAAPTGQATPAGCYTENRATLHLHGGRTPWISDGTPHQWITPAGEPTTLVKGESLFNVPDMPDPGPGSQTFYWTNQQSSRLMFYHDHASGITRLNVYQGEAAGYVITDDMEQHLIARGVLPDIGIPLVMTEKTFVDATMVPNPAGGTIEAVRLTDPTWNWGTGPMLANNVRQPKTGDLWWPHVYVPAANPYDQSGVNPYGRWAYGPWFFPPMIPKYPTVPNPLADTPKNDFSTGVGHCNPDLAPFYCQPDENPGTPLVSWGAEAFLDTPVINGTAYPVLTVQPKPTRFRILNANHDRFQNLSIFQAVPAVGDLPTLPAGCLGVAAGCTEVRMLPAIPPVPATLWPPTWPADGRAGGVPDPATKGPDMVQIGTEGGFLPRPVVIPAHPIYWNLDPTTFNVGNVQGGALILGPAERADVIVDFTAFAGKTLILYNDAPAAYPALDPRMDYYTGAPDFRDTGGTTEVLAGFGPNIRTIMQIKVSASATAPILPANWLARLQAAWNPPAGSDNPEFVGPAGTFSAPTPFGVFQKSQEQIIVGQKTYNQLAANIYGDLAAKLPVYKNPNTPALAVAFPNTVAGGWGMARVTDTTINFKTLATASTTPASAPYTFYPMLPKAIHDEMNSSQEDYGRMSAKLGLEMPNASFLNAQFVVQPYVDPTTEIIQSALPGSFVPGDGGQIWKITHNGVDTHPIHFHLFDVQLINRAGWDGAIRLPDENELGWKDTLRISPLEDTIVAVRSIAPRQPFGIPDSVRRRNPAMPLGATEGFSQLNPTNGNAASPVTTNESLNFGWEYVWHCHILSHEEQDMMRAVTLDMSSKTLVPPAPSPLAQVGATAGISWTDPSPVANPATVGNMANEVGFIIERSPVPVVVTPTSFAAIGRALANATTFTVPTPPSPGPYAYRVRGYNAAAPNGGPPSNEIQITLTTATPPTAPSGLVASPASATWVNLTWNDNANNETSFVVERATDAGFTLNLVPLPASPAVLGPNTAAYTDTTAVTGTPYFYRVFALNGTVRSAASNTATSTLTNTLNAPSNLRVTLLTGPRARLLWNDNSTSETGFRVQRAPTADFVLGPVTEVIVGANTTTYDDGTIRTDTTYFYRVLATIAGNPVQDSAPSNVITVGPPAVPTNLAIAQAVAAGSNVILTFTDGSINESSFTIQRSINNGAFTAKATSAARTGTGTVVTVTDPITTFPAPGPWNVRYRVRANNQLGSSAWVIVPAAGQFAVHP